MVDATGAPSARASIQRDALSHGYSQRVPPPLPPGPRVRRVARKFACASRRDLELCRRDAAAQAAWRARDALDGWRALDRTTRSGCREIRPRLRLLCMSSASFEAEDHLGPGYELLSQTREPRSGGATMASADLGNGLAEGGGGERQSGLVALGRKFWTTRAGPARGEGLAVTRHPGRYHLPRARHRNSFRRKAEKRSARSPPELSRRRMRAKRHSRVCEKVEGAYRHATYPDQMASPPERANTSTSTVSAPVGRPTNATPGRCVHLARILITRTTRRRREETFRERSVSVRSLPDAYEKSARRAELE